MADKWICIFPFLFASFLPVAAIAQASPNQAPDRTWITDVRIISPEKLDHIEKGSVLIENGRIVRVERKTGAKKPAGARVVSGEGQFLIPGLIDSHVHLASIPGIRPEVNLSGRSQTHVDQGILQTASAFYLYFGLPRSSTWRSSIAGFGGLQAAPYTRTCMTVVNLCLCQWMSDVVAPPEARFNCSLPGLRPQSSLHHSRSIQAARPHSCHSGGRGQEDGWNLR